MVITLPPIFPSVLKQLNQLEVQRWLEIFIVAAAAQWMYLLLYVTLLQKLKTFQSFTVPVPPFLPASFGTAKQSDLEFHV